MKAVVTTLTDSEGKPATETVQSVVPVEVRAEIKADMISESRSESAVIKRILVTHYAKRLKARAVQQQRRAA